MVILLMANDNDKPLTPDNIIQIINDFLHEEFEVDRSRIIPSADLKTTLDLDSLDYIDLVRIPETIKETFEGNSRLPVSSGKGLNRLLSSIGLVATRESSPASGLWWLCSRGRGGRNVGHRQEFADSFSGSNDLFDGRYKRVFAKPNVVQRFQVTQQPNEFWSVAGEVRGGFRQQVHRRGLPRRNRMASSWERRAR